MMVAEERQVPAVVLKHPPESWMPLAKVEVALVAVTLSTVAFTPWRLVEVPATAFTNDPPATEMPFVEESPAVAMPPANVEDAVDVELIAKIVEVPYAVMGPAIVVEPCTEKRLPGVLVPMPRFVPSNVRLLAESMVLVEE